MKQKSLRQLAKELGVSASYLSQVRHGKRPASDTLLNALDNLSVKQSVKRGEVLYRYEIPSPRGDRQSLKQS